jgi:hypothetical protein
VTRFAAAVGLSLALAGPLLAQGKIGEALGYTKPVGGGAFTFVQLGDAAAEAKVADAAARFDFSALRMKYPKTGLYRGDTTELVWAVEGGGFSPYDYTYPASDGVHLVRFEGEWWKTKDFPGQARLPADDANRQLDGPGLAFFANGKLLRRYTVRELVTEAERLPHTPEHVLWTSGGVLNEGKGTFLLLTQDAYRITFDYRTGEVVSKAAGGLGNPLMTPILIACGVLSALLVGAWAYFAFLRKKTTV